MKAAVYTRYGPPDVLKVEEIDEPVPEEGEVLVRVGAASMNRSDCGFRSAQYVVSRLATGLFKPRRTVSGSEFAGEVVGLGADVTEFEVGDKVFGFFDVRGGAHAEFLTARAAGAISKMPEGFSFEQVAASTEGATYALSAIDSAKVSVGQKVMVYGASGAIGSAAVQILEALGAKVIYDAVGKSSYGVCKRLLGPKGIYYSTELGKGAQNPLLALGFAITRSRKVIFPIPRINKEKIERICAMLAAGTFKPLMDRTFDLDDIVEAARYVETGQKVGNVLIRIG